MIQSQNSNLTAYKIIETLHPYLVAASKYAIQIQKHIKPLPNKDYQNIFTQALSAADLTIQSTIELAVLAHFPKLHFFGEEHEKSHNTPYLAGTSWHPNALDPDSEDRFLLLLDPIDGTRFFLDGHDNFQIILSVLTPFGFEGAIFMSPARNEYFYALKNQGLFRAFSIDTPMSGALKYQPPSFLEPKILFSSKLDISNPSVISNSSYSIYHTMDNYSKTNPSLMANDLFLGKLCGVVYGEPSYIDGGTIVFAAKEAGLVVAGYNNEPLPQPGLTSDLIAPPAIIASKPDLVELIIKAAPVLKS